jgi:excinuclease ABC subunit C
VEVLNRHFRLRDCSSKQPCSFTEQMQLFDIALRPGCIRLEIASCLGPCIAACSRNTYGRQVALARAFLDGKDDSPLADIELAMQRAAKNLHFEQATVLREDLKAVSWLSRRVSDMALARERYTFVYPVTIEATAEQPIGQSSRTIWYLIRRGLVEGAVAAPVSESQKRQTTAVLQKWLASENCVGNRFVPRPETLALVASWFRNHRSELKRTLLPATQLYAMTPDSANSTSVRTITPVPPASMKPLAES